MRKKYRRQPGGLMIMKKLLFSLLIVAGVALSCTASLSEDCIKFAHSVTGKIERIEASRLPNPEKIEKLTAVGDRIVEKENEKLKNKQQKRTRREEYDADLRRLGDLHNKIRETLKKYQ
jgi:hypothetical protein